MPICPITVSAEEDAIVALDWGWGRGQGATPLRLRAGGSRRNNHFVASRFRLWRLKIGRSATVGGGEGIETRRFILAFEHRAAASRAGALVQQSRNSHPVSGSVERISGSQAARELCESPVLLEFDVRHVPGSPRQAPLRLRSLACDDGRWIEAVLAVGAWPRKRGANLKFSTRGRAGLSQNIGNGVTR